MKIFEFKKKKSKNLLTQLLFTKNSIKLGAFDIGAYRPSNLMINCLNNSFSNLINNPNTFKRPNLNNLKFRHVL